MSLSGKYSPMNLNAMGALLQSSGFTINQTAAGFMGSSTAVSNYTKGTIVSQTVLNQLVDSIRLAYPLISTITQATYNNLISIGSSSIPALGNSVPSTYTNTYSGEATSYGFLRSITLQAYTEFHVNNGTYQEFVSTFNQCESFKQKSNNIIKGFNSAKTFMAGSFSTMNDLMSGDITGVSMSTLFWGQDLINLGRSLDLTIIDQFGLPSVLLRTLNKSNAITRSLSLAIMSAGLTGTDVDNILSGKPVPTEQEKLLFAAFSLIMGVDLQEILIPLNCQTTGLDSLTDLINPKAMFPVSYKTLTVPQYNAVATPTNSKTYYFIYTNGEPNVLSSTGYGTRLRNIMPEAMAYACDAFSVSMQQIKNIKNMNIEKFSQVVANLECVTGLDVGASNTPTNVAIATAASSAVALGTGPNGTYTTCDFFGAMSGESYQWSKLQGLIQSLQTSNLATIYSNIYTLLSGAGPYTTLQTLIDSANIEIAAIYAANTAKAQELNTLYNSFGTSLAKEQQARSLALPSLTDLTTTTSDIYGFIDNLGQYASDTQSYGPSRVIEAIANTSTIGGNSLIGSMREIRNALRLGLTGIKLDNDVVDEVIPAPRVGVSDGYSNTNKLPIVTGTASTPGSLAGSPETMLIPDNLSIYNIPTKVLTPDEAVHEVTLCNCDCWDDL